MRLAISCGDVNGIGLRCLASACQEHSFSAALALAIDAPTLEAAIERYHLTGTIKDGIWHCGANAIELVPVHSATEITPGIPRDDASRCAIASLNVVIDLAAREEADAIVTLPINKHALTAVGWPYPGQTEMVADAADGVPLMVLATRTLRVALATVHIPVRDIERMLSVERIAERIAQLRHHLVADLGLIDPQIAVLALDPHAGEHGVIGTADDAVVRPAIDLARANEIHVDGPFPADGFFGFGAYTKYDGVLAMYHDQGLIPLKLLAEGAGVNCTAGLSIVRTSPDHGTAYDRALSGTIDHRSTAEAIDMAHCIARKRANTSCY
jgi:4-hydroxythreonine-4-phosphate dehydrogenase